MHPQRQAGLNWIGVTLPVGKMTAAEMRGLSAIARDFGDGDIRLTVWQNLLLSGVPDARVEEAKAAIERLGLGWKASSLRAGLVACTGATGCKFAAAHTKEHAAEIADHVDARLSLDAPVNVHLTGCHHSCAQHYIGDIGLMGVKVAINDEGDQVEGLQDRCRRRFRRPGEDRPRDLAGGARRGMRGEGRGPLARLSRPSPGAGREFSGLLEPL